MESRFVLERVTQPESEPVTTAEMKRHLGEFDSVTERDGDIDSLVTAAREWAEHFTGRALMDQTWRLTVDQLGYISGDDVSGYVIRPGYYSGRLVWVSALNEIRLRKSPVLAITSIVSVDSAGAETTIDASTYELREADSKWPRVVGLNGTTWGAGTFRITFRAGYADTTGSPQQTSAEVPARFKNAIKFWAEAHYDRDSVMMEKLVKAAEDMIRPERVELGLA